MPLKFAEVPVRDTKVLIPVAFNPVVIPAMKKSLTVVSPRVLIPGAFNQIGRAHV